MIKHQKLLLGVLIASFLFLGVGLGNANAIGNSVVINTPADNSFSNSATVSITGVATSQTSGFDATHPLTYTLNGGASTDATSFNNSTGAFTINLSGLSDGLQTVVVTELSNDTSSSFATVHFTVDTTNPVSAISSPADNSTSSSATVNLSGTSSDTNLVSTQISVDGGALQPTSGTASNWTFSATGLADGVHTFQTTATDSAGNTGTSTIVHVNVNTNNPAVVISSPADNSFSNSASVGISGTASLSSGTISSVSYTLDGGASTPATGTSSWTIALSGLSEGSHTVVVSALGSNGLTGTATVHFTVDTTNPVSAISSPADNSTSSSATVNLSGTSSDTNLVSTQISVDGGALQPTSGTASNWTFSATGLADGVHTFQTTATDSAGNTATSSVVHVTVDTTNPVSAISSPADNSISSSATVNLSGTSSDTNLVSTQISVDGGALQPTSGTASNWTFSATGLADGVHTFQTTATDSAGNTATSSVVHVTVDTVNPNVVITTPVDNFVSGSHNVAVSGTANGTGTNIASITYTIDGNAGTQTVTGTATWSFTTESMADGSHTIVVTATDQAGNTNTATVHVTVNSNLPAVVISSPADNSFSNSASVGISGTASLSSGTISSVSYTLDGGASTPATGTSSWTIALSGLSEGSHTVVVSALGSNGLTGTATVHFTVDTVNPNVVITTPVDNFVSGSHNVAVSGTANGTGTNIASITYTIDGNAGTQTVTGTATWSFTTESMADGSHTIVVTATDQAGNTNTATVHVTVDSALPTVIPSPAGGNYNTAQSVTLTGSTAGTIYFTTDGTTPTTSSTQYTAPIVISTTTTLKFFEQNLGLVSGSVQTEQYNINSGLPVITLLGTNPQVVTVGSTYFESGATAVDALNANLTGSIIIDSSAVNTNVVGNYSVTYDVTDSFANHAQAIRTVSVQPIVFSFHSGGYASAVPSQAVPSLGGGNIGFSDGLTINGVPHDISKFNQDITKQQFPIGKPVDIVVKQAPLFGSTKYKSTTMYFNFGGKDLETYNAQTVLSYDVSTGSTITDPSGFMKNVKIGTNIVDENIVETHFMFTPAKAMPDTSIILQSVDTYGRVNNAKVHGAIQFGLDAPVIVKSNPNVLTFNDIESVQKYLTDNYYQKPELIAHVHDSASMFGNTGGNVYWTVNLSDKTLSVHAVDKTGNEVWNQSTLLTEQPMHPKGFGQTTQGHMSDSYAPTWVAGGAYNANAFKMPPNMK